MIRSNGISTLAAICSCAVGTLAIAFLCHQVMTFGVPRHGQDTVVTRYLQQGLLHWPSGLALLALAMTAGFFTQVRTRWVVAGFILPFPIAVIYECSRSPQAHNLMPFEIAMFWVPVGVVAAIGCGLGRLLARRLRQPS